MINSDPSEELLREFLTQWAKTHEHFCQRWIPTPPEVVAKQREVYEQMMIEMDNLGITE